MEKPVLMCEVIIKRRIKIEYIKVKVELMWLRIRRMAIKEQPMHEIAGYF